MSEIDPRHRALLRTLVARELRFVLVGGVALQLYGFSGATLDLDVTIAVDEPNGRRLECVLSDIAAQPYLAGERGTAYRTQLGQLEVMRWTHGVGDYDAWARSATTIEVEPGVAVLVGSASDLLLAKEQADRSKDAEALPLIRAELLAAGALNQIDVRGPVAELPAPAPIDPNAEALLGPRPLGRRERGAWEHAAELIAEYRARWQPADDGTPLGERPTEAPQAQDLLALERQLSRLRRLVTRCR